jgi:hypothetical protein
MNVEVCLLRRRHGRLYRRELRIVDDCGRHVVRVVVDVVSGLRTTAPPPGMVIVMSGGWPAGAERPQNQARERPPPQPPRPGGASCRVQVRPRFVAADPLDHDEVDPAALDCTEVLGQMLTPGWELAILEATRGHVDTVAGLE